MADRADDADTAELVEQFLLQIYADESAADTETASHIPREILVPVMPASGGVMAQLLSEQRHATVNLHVPHRGDKRVLLDTVARNAAEALQQHKMRRAGDLSTRNRALEQIQQVLELETAPLRIECYDISHLQGTEVVGSMVVFEDGLPRKSEYRRFVIRSFEGSDDLRAMREVLTRRFRRLLDDRASMSTDAEGGPLLVDATTGAARKFAYAPALVVVDGGQPQVQAAADVLEELGLSDEIALCGLAKRLEEVWVPDEEYPLILPRTSEGLYLLQRLRDEAHRFAITHHRGRRSKAMVESVLDDVPGLGEVRRKALLKHFGSMKKLRSASVEQIALVPGFGSRLAQSVAAAMASQRPGEAVNVTTGEVIET